MSHRRYQNPQKGYSRRDRRQHIEDDVNLWFADDDVATAPMFADLAPMMQVDPLELSATAAPTPAAPVETAAAVGTAAPVAHATTVNHGTAFQIDEAQTNPKIRALDRLLAMIKKSR